MTSLSLAVLRQGLAPSQEDTKVFWPWEEVGLDILRTLVTWSLLCSQAA